MKHILNEMNDEERNSIRSQYTGTLSVQTGKFKQLVENKLGNAKPLVSEQLDSFTAFDEQAPERRVKDMDSGKITGTHKYGVGYTPNEFGKSLGHSSHPTSIPNYSKFEDEDDEDEDDESYLNEDYDSEAILNPTSIKYSKNPNVDVFLKSVFPRLNTEETMNAFRKLLRNDELWEKFSRLMRMFGYNSYHNKEEIFDKVIEWANERGNDEDRGNDEEIW